MIRSERIIMFSMAVVNGKQFTKTVEVAKSWKVRNVRLR